MTADRGMTSRDLLDTSNGPTPDAARPPACKLLSNLAGRMGWVVGQEGCPSHKINGFLPRMSLSRLQ
jgi:hypothetical protein